MKSLEFQITAITPLIMSRTTASGNHLESFDHIPGSSILGVLAGRYVKNHVLGKMAHQDEQFKRLFLSDAISYRQATLKIMNSRSQVMPLHIHQEKSAKKPYLDVFETNPSNPAKYKRRYISSHHVGLPKMMTSFHTSRGAERLAGRSLSGGIFTYTGLASGQQFLGEVIGSDDDIEVLKELIIADSNVHLGRSKTAQYGSASIEVMNVREITPGQDDFSDQSFTLSLKSPALIHNKFGHPSTQWQDVALTIQKQCELSAPLECEQLLVRNTSIETFNRMWGLKRPSEAALEAGSVFKIAAGHGISRKGIDQLLFHGLGHRRNEGYGEVSIESIQVDHLNASAKPAIKKMPEGSPPEAFLAVYKNVAQREVKLLAERVALEAALQPTLPHSLTVDLRDLFKSKDSLGEIARYIELSQTQKEDGKTVDKGRATHLKRVKLDGKYLFDVLKDAKVFHERILDEIGVSESVFLQESAKALSLPLDQYREFAWKSYWGTLLTKHLKGKQA
ncbi:MAG: hypothetical protein U9Q77_11365 [Candidatus Marinimicrobia bacterium]|nr:hypothetical protein [Candidatus Neomarinimicrobiota bacterium]